MAPTVRAVGTVAAVASGNLTPGLPAGTVAFDLLLACFMSKDNVAQTLTGWLAADAALPFQRGAAHQVHVLWKQAAGGDATTFTHTAGNSCIGRIIGITAGTWDTADPFGGFATGTTDGVIPTTATDIADCLMLAVVGMGDDDAAGGSAFGAWTWNAVAMDERIDNGTSLGTDCQLGAATYPYPGTASPGTGTYTETAAGAGVAGNVILAIRPAAVTAKSDAGLFDRRTPRRRTLQRM